MVIEDRNIVALLFERSEEALTACKTKYGAYFHTILFHILRNPEDAEECFNDVLLSTWNSIPPTRPESLKSYMGTLARNLGIDRYTRGRAQKRTGQTEELLEEITAFTPEESAEDQVLYKNLVQEINAFLGTLEEGTRVCFVLRYYHAFSNEEIARKTGKSPHAVASLLHKTRERLKAYLAKCGTTV